MLIDFSVENFKSIKERITFSLKSTGSKKIFKNVIKNSSLSHPSLVKNAVIFGANATGKSNLIKSLFFIYEMVVTSDRYNVDTKIPRVPYKFDKETINRPSKFDINFIYEGIHYNYGFSCTDSRITEEYLYTIKKDKKTLIFKRYGSNSFRFRHDRTRQSAYGKQTIPNVLYVSRATQLGNERTRPVYEFFSRSLHINSNLGLPSWRQTTLESISKDPSIKERIIEILRGFDFGGIDDIKINKESSPMKQITLTGKDSAPSSVVNFIKEVYDVKFIHKLDNESFQLELDEESAGTTKTFDLIGPILDTLDKGYVMVIDELDSSLHPEVSELIVRLFTSRHNRNNAQLIFTTHNLAFLDNELFRKDQIFFCDKEPNKATTLHSLSDMNIRQEANFQNAYRERRFGGVPFVDRTYAD